MSADTEQQLQARLQEALEERARLWDEVNRLRAERRELEYYEALAKKMESSLSWQITAPLRDVKRLAAKIREKLDERRG